MSTSEQVPRGLTEKQGVRLTPGLKTQPWNRSRDAEARDRPQALRERAVGRKRSTKALACIYAHPMDTDKGRVKAWGRRGGAGRGQWRGGGGGQASLWGWVITHAWPLLTADPNSRPHPLEVLGSVCDPLSLPNASLPGSGGGNRGPGRSPYPCPSPCPPRSAGAVSWRPGDPDQPMKPHSHLGGWK